jgi:hypothetical protein
VNPAAENTRPKSTYLGANSDRALPGRWGWDHEDCGEEKEIRATGRSRDSDYARSQRGCSPTQRELPPPYAGGRSHEPTPQRRLLGVLRENKTAFFDSASPRNAESHDAYGLGTRVGTRIGLEAGSTVSIRSRGYFWCSLGRSLLRLLRHRIGEGHGRKRSET